MVSPRPNTWKSIIPFSNRIRTPKVDPSQFEGRCKIRNEVLCNIFFFGVELFYHVIDMQLLELNQHFDEVNTDLLLCMTCFAPKDSFSAFDIEKLLRLAKFYPSEFSGVVLYELESQLENFIFDVRLDKKFSKVSGIGGLAQEMVSTRKPLSEDEK